ncbi:uncharacterized protein LOC125873721 [Solanum stenotomum]|uniref:uncharacterized protein LOC125873721 n=1 Tax=Solanum stenotomum TaxID=172797 RepID=UPI0020D1F291|nr:uncharacterized protein LOC125873721 [Solanum stenotomum]
MAPCEALYGRTCRSTIGWFEVGEVEFDRARLSSSSHGEGVMGSCKKGKLSPRFIGPYTISKRVGNVAYELELPSELAAVHLVFHIFMLKKCLGDPSIIVPTENIGIKDNLSYEEIIVQMLYGQAWKLRTKKIASVKVLWRKQLVEEAT